MQTKSAVADTATLEWKPFTGSSLSAGTSIGRITFRCPVCDSEHTAVLYIDASVPVKSQYSLECSTPGYAGQRSIVSVNWPSYKVQ